MRPRWAALLGATALLGLAGAAVGVPSPELFAGVFAGAGAALLAGWTAPVPGPARTGAQVLLGVAIGVVVQAASVRALGGALLPVLLAGAATLALSVVAGLAMARFTDVDPPTAAFGMIAGGASGVVAIARELGADERLVAVMQYLRVLVVVVLTPVVAHAVFGAGSGAGAGASGGAGAGGARPGGALQVVALVAVASFAGLALARLTRLPAGTLLGPMLAAAALALAGAPFAVAVPGALQSVAFAVIGLDVGLGFTAQTVRTAARILLPALVTIAALMVLSALLGLALAALSGRTALEGYLATTPGGLYAVLAIAVGSGADTTFVLGVQALRLVVMLLAAPLLARAVAGARSH